MKNMSDMNDTKRLILYLIFMTIICSIFIGWLFRVKHNYELKNFLNKGYDDMAFDAQNTEGLLGSVPVNKDGRKLIEFEKIDNCIDKDFISYLYADEHLKNILIKGKVEALDDSIVSDVSVCSNGELVVYNKAICKNILLEPKAIVKIESNQRLVFTEFVNESKNCYLISEINEKSRNIDNKYLEIPGKFILTIDQKSKNEILDDL